MYTVLKMKGNPLNQQIVSKLLTRRLCGNLDNFQLSLECSLRNDTHFHCGNHFTFWILPHFFCDMNKRHKSAGAAVSATPQRRRGSDALAQTGRALQALLSQRWMAAGN